jgi:Uma2 family endonuclease
MAMKAATKKFTVDEYYRMAEAGILGEDDRVELIEGEIVEMPPIGNSRARTVDRLTMAIVPQLVALDAFATVQNPIRLSRNTEPLPDFVLVRGNPGALTEHPGPEEVLLVVEVSDSTLRSDRNRKLPSYARAGIREVWLINLPARTVEVMRSPRGDSYSQIETLRGDDTLSPVALPHVRIRVSDILG